MSKTTTIPLNGHVECDGCSKDFTSSSESGGLLFGSYGYGPCCVDRMRQTIEKYGEDEYIRAVCPEGKSFADWVRQDIRGDAPGADDIVITSLTP